MSEEVDGKPFEDLSPQWAFGALIVGLLIYGIFSWFSDPGRARAAAICSGMIVIVVGARWDIKNYKWFWAVITIVAILHVPLLFRIAWSDRSYPGLTLLPFGVLDFAIYYLIIWIVEKLSLRRAG